jgi:hypothetical protein
VLKCENLSEYQDHNILKYKIYEYIHIKKEVSLPHPVYYTYGDIKTGKMY